ncbi:MAG: hypothetical protein LBH25_10835 [Fibromonadaceae bacterium]|jgi:hypothetical protein|nr:hypothetical protein [Fibromonadaceae bacterium]
MIKTIKNSNMWKIIILLVFLAALFLASLIGYAALKTKAIFFLSNSISAGDVLIIPQNFQSQSPLKLSWESISVAINGTGLFFSNPKISIYSIINGRRELLNVSIDSVHISIAAKSSKDSSKSELQNHIGHPDLRIPFRVSVNVKKVALDVEDVGNWGLDSLVAVKSGRQKKIYIRASNISGNHLAKNLFLSAEYMWNELFSDALLLISDRETDSISVSLNAPRVKLEDLSADISARVENLPFWLKDKWPDAAPEIKKIALNSNLSANVLQSKVNFNLSLYAKIGEFWQLPPFDAAVKVSGNNKGISQSEVSLKGSNEESIKLKGNANWDLDGSAELEVKGINITLGPETLPIDAKVHKITKNGNSVFANFATEAGSNFIARVANINNPIITFSADISPKEPWAVQWTGDMVKLSNSTTLTGSFSVKETVLNANLRTGVPFAYHAAVDELEVLLWLNPDGIRFPKGTIRHKGHESSFNGEVMWNKQYFAFKLKQQDEGTAEIYGTFNPKTDLNLKIDLSLQNLNSSLLPFADSAMLKGYNGIISGNWVHDFGNKAGEASVIVSTVVQGLSIYANSDVKINGDSLFVKRIEIEQNEKKISGSLFALLPSETRENFDLQKTSINIPNMNLVSLLATFNDSTLASGFANGRLVFDKANGLKGEIAFSQIAIRNLDPSIAKFPNIRLKADGDYAKISSRIFLAGDLWNGDLEASIGKLEQKKNFPIKVSYATNSIGNIGNLNFDGFLSKDFKKAFGDAQLKGDWFLPDGIGEIKNINLNISASTALGKNVMDSLNADFSAKKNLFEKDILKIPFDFNGHIKNGMLRVDSVHVYGQQDEKITAKLQFDLASAQLKHLSFKTEIFTLFLLNEHWIKIRNGAGKTILDNDGITIFAEFPSITYRMESSAYGTAHVAIDGQATYRFPFQVGKSQTNPSLDGNFEISNINYRKNFDMEFSAMLKQTGNFLSSMPSAFREKNVNAAEKHAIIGKPTNLNVRIRTRGTETASINSNLLEFPFAVNLSVLGTTKNMLFSGDINSVDNGKIGYNSLTMFDLSFFRIYWQDLPLKHGEIEIRASNDYPFCEAASNEGNCTISLNVTGTFSKFNMQPSTSCNVDASPALIYYSMLLGCISENYESNIDLNKHTGRLLSSLISSTANKGLGENVVGDIELKWKLDQLGLGLGGVPKERDTNYVRIPFSLSNFVPNLEMILGYTEDVSLDRRYDYSKEIGLRYRLPVFDSTDINRNFIDPSLDLSSNLIQRNYISGTESGQAEASLEQSVGLVYKHKFWDPCLLGIGRCNKE